eukprot:COSAG02_NODE_10666_length_1887_cov_1.157159_2_plen_64_part_00
MYWVHLQGYSTVYRLLMSDLQQITDGQVSIDPYEAHMLCRALGVPPPPDASATRVVPLPEDVQ